MIPEFPPDSFPGWIILGGLVVFTIMFVLIPVAIPVGYGVRGVARFVKRRTARKADPEKEAVANE